MRGRPAFALFALSSFSLFAIPGGAIPDKSKDAAAEALLKQAHDLTDIRAEGSSPFRLVARVFTYDEKGAPKEGSYTLIWKTPTSWRDEIRWPDFAQVRVAAGDMLYVARSQSAMTLEAYLEPALLNFDQYLVVRPGHSVTNLREREKGKERSLEIMKKGVVTAEIFLDGSVALPSRFTLTGHSSEVRLEDYRDFGGRHFPTVLSQGIFGKQFLRVEVRELAATTPDEAQLAPLKNASAFPWCPDPTLAEFEGVEGMAALYPTEMPRGQATIYGIIGTDGHWEGLQVIRPQGAKSKTLVWILLYMQHQRFRPATCGDRPVPEEEIIVMHP